MLRFSRSELAVLGVLLAIGLVALGFRLRSASQPSNQASSAAVQEFTLNQPSKPATQQTAPKAPTLANNPASVRVHVVGEVQNPGTYSLPIGSRVEDAIRAAGGYTPSASPGTLNLAEKLEDGRQVFINSIQQPVAPTPKLTTAAPVGDTGSPPI